MVSKLPKFARLPAASRPRRSCSLLLMAIVGAMVLFYILLTLAPCIVSGVCYHGYRSDFSFDLGLISHPTWMADIPDEVNITSLSIPGTHDTMTYEIGSETLQCQNWNISTQLDAGLRYFDIRARLRDDRLHIYHGYGDTGFGFKDVLLAMFEFLDAHPSETIIMRLKRESTPIGHNNTITFEDAFNYHRLNSSSTSEGSSKHLYLYDRKAPIPTLGALRSKIFILQEFEAPNHGPYGLEWDGRQMVLEDLWIIPDVYHLSEKWTAIRQALEVAGTTPHDNSVLYLSHVSAAVGVLPIEAAAGPMNRTVTGMNDMTGQWLEDFEDEPGYSRTGVMILDFPGRRLAGVILRWNDKLKVDHNVRRKYLFQRFWRSSHAASFT